MPIQYAHENQQARYSQSPEESLERGSKEAEVVGELDWDGPNDPENPRDWPLFKRCYHTLVPSLFNFAVTFGTSIYTPGVPQVIERFGVSRTAAFLPLSLYSLGLAFGPVLGAPISETKGRRAVYLGTFPISLLFSVGAALSQNFGTLLVCRFFAGAFGSPTLALGAGTIADVWDLQESGASTASAAVILAPFMGPIIGPLVGGYTILHKDWRWLMWGVLFVGGPIYLLAFFTQETYKKTIFARRARARGITLPLGPSGAEGLKLILTVTLFRPIHMLFTEPIVAAISLYIAFVFGVLFEFFASYPYAFTRVHSFDSGEVGLAFLGLLVGLIASVATFEICNKTLYSKAVGEAKLRGGRAAPEHRLYASMLGSFGIPISLFWFSWSMRKDVHWISPILAGIPFGWGNLCLFLGTTNYLIDLYESLNGASAMAANGLLRYTFGAVFPLFALQMYEKLGIQWAGSLLGFISLLLLPVPWVLFKWGDKIRAKSQYPVAGF
ncbi:MFS general substrate transporter [Choiromyces venosus 120613-1]|uniref:MFS general substrate transporter n=1 Tax=Choiromyces venosus 120613-1 TaxID=1336337 RepID=A0A3N4K2M5_9PEZI|nr:MFS general substrate transporter [Choiromyces venosus 120613-1]